MSDPIRARLVSYDTGEFTCDAVWDLTAALRAVLDECDEDDLMDAREVRRVIAEHLGVPDA